VDIAGGWSQHRIMAEDARVVKLDAKLFQEPLARLAETMVQKVFREGSAHLGAPPFVGEDMAVIIRHALSTYDLLCYLNADERRIEDCDWRPAYGVCAMPLVRSLIDCFFNVTLILQSPAKNGFWYRQSGLKKVLKGLDDDSERYRGDADSEAYIVECRSAVDLSFMRPFKLTIEEILGSPDWPTLGRYLSQKQKGATLNEHQTLLQTFTYRAWRQYSALSHGGMEGFIDFLGHFPVGMYYMTDFLPKKLRPQIDNSYVFLISAHIARAATVLLAMITELQAYCRFDGANIDQRVAQLWIVLLPILEAKELYDGRYAQLMKDSRMVAA